MKHRIIVLALAVVALVGTWFALSWLRLGEQRIAPGEERVSEDTTQRTATSVPYRIEELVGGLEVPWGIAFPSEGRILVTERPGRVRQIVSGLLDPKPIHVFPEVSTGGEEGLMALALHPRYAENRFVYFALAYEAEGEMWMKIVRMTDEGAQLTNPVVILDRTPGARFHIGTRIGFGPDGKLYVTTGDAIDRDLAQEMGSLAGKTLRMNDDGSVPSDNPFPESLVYTLGHRNAQGMDWAKDGMMYQSEHGPSVFDGPAGGDEVNRIEAGANYGWPLVSHEKTRAGTVSPLAVFTPAEAPGSLLVYSGKMFPQWEGDVFFGALRGEGIVRLSLSPDGKRVGIIEKLSDVQYGRIRDIVEAPDGSIYFSTSNRDGRGDPVSEDDRIFRIVAEE